MNSRELLHRLAKEELSLEEFEAISAESPASLSALVAAGHVQVLGQTLEGDAYLVTDSGYAALEEAEADEGAGRPEGCECCHTGRACPCCPLHGRQADEGVLS